VRPSQIKQVAATGQVVSGRNQYVRDVVLTAAAAAATLELRDSDGSGAVLLTVKAAVESTVSVQLTDAVFGGGIHATLTGAAALATLVYA
jgi:hypothetical protein